MRRIWLLEAEVLKVWDMLQSNIWGMKSKEIEERGRAFLHVVDSNRADKRSFALGFAGSGLSNAFLGSCGTYERV